MRSNFSLGPVGKRYVIVAAIFAAAVLLFLLAWPVGPSYKGKSVRTWFYQPSGDDREAFRAMGAAALPFLITRLEDAPSERLYKLLQLPGRTPGLVYRQRKQSWQQRAAVLLGDMGGVARPAASHLARMAAGNDWFLRGAATVALMKIEGQSIDPLIEKLRDTSDPTAWYEHAVMTGQFGAQAAKAVPTLLEALQHTNNVIQAHALIALGMIGEQPDKCVPAILPFLASPNLSDRQKAIGALLAFGTNAVTAKKQIAAALKDPDPWVRRSAAEVMKILEPIELPRESTLPPAKQ